MKVILNSGCLILAILICSFPTGRCCDEDRFFGRIARVFRRDKVKTLNHGAPENVHRRPYVHPDDRASTTSTELSLFSISSLDQLEDNANFVDPTTKYIIFVREALRVIISDTNILGMEGFMRKTLGTGKIENFLKTIEAQGVHIGKYFANANFEMKKLIVLALKQFFRQLNPKLIKAEETQRLKLMERYPAGTDLREELAHIFNRGSVLERTSIDLLFQLLKQAMRIQHELNAKNLAEIAATGTVAGDRGMDNAAFINMVVSNLCETKVTHDEDIKSNGGLFYAINTYGEGYAMSSDYTFYPLNKGVPYVPIRELLKPIRTVRSHENIRDASHEAAAVVQSSDERKEHRIRAVNSEGDVRRLTRTPALRNEDRTLTAIERGDTSATRRVSKRSSVQTLGGAQ